MSNSKENANENNKNDAVIRVDNSDNVFFTIDEYRAFFKPYDDMILTQDNGMPYINYITAKKLFEKTVGGNYSTTLLSDEFDSDHNVYIVRLRVTLTRGNKSISRDCIGCAEASLDKDGKVRKFGDLPKSAITDAFKKFLSDYIGIGSLQLADAKEKYKQSNANKGSKWKNNSQGQASTGEFKCSDCGAPIDENVFNFSKAKHREKRPLCLSCQKNY